VISGIYLKIGGSRELSPVAQMVEGFRFIAGNELFRHLMLLSFATMFFASSYMQLMPAFADLLDAGETGYGMLLSATGVGSVIGTVVVGAANPTRNYGMFMLACAGTSALGLYGFAFATLIPSYPLALLACAIAAAFVSVFLILSTTAMQVEVPDALRGRVMGIHGITYSLMPLGGLVLGAAGDYVGVSAAVMISATVFLGILMIITTASTRVRQLQSPQLNA
jgi:MFS family permease